MSKLALELLHGQGETTLPTMKPEGKGGAKKERVKIDFSKSDFRAVNEYDGDEMLNLLLVDDRIPAGAKLY